MLRTAQQRVHARLEWMSDALLIRGPRYLPNGSRFSEAALHAALRPGHQISRLAARIFPGLRNLHFRVGRQQPAVVEQGHELETHVDRPGGADGAAAVNARIEA